MLIPNPFYAAYAAGAVAANCEPVYLPATAATGFLPDLDALSEELLARTVAFFIASPANPQGAVAGPPISRGWRARAPLRLPRVQRRVLFRDLYPGPPAGMLEAAGPTSPTWSCSSRCRSARTCRACASASPPATGASSRASSSCATSRRRRCRCRRSGWRSPPTATRRMSRRTAGSTSRKFDLADQIIGDRYGYRRPAGGFFLWLDVSGAGRRRGGGAAAVARGGAARRARPLSRARPGRRLNPGAATSASPWCRTGDHGRGAASPGRGAGLRTDMSAIDRGLELSFLALRRVREALRRAPARARRRSR